MVSVVPEKAVMLPSMKYVGSGGYATRTREPTVNAVLVELRLVVKVLLPVPMATEDEDVRP